MVAMPRRRTRLVPALALVGVLALSVAACSSDDDGQDVSAATTEAVAHDDAVRLNEIQVIGSHNSYHISNFDQIGGISPLAATLDYTHEPLPDQLDGGLRSFELDVYRQDDGELHVLHFPGFDEISTCDLFTDCLGEIGDWSKGNPDHAPLSVLVEVKSPAREMGASGMDQIDADIRSVFAPEDLITPDDVRGDEATLADAVPDGWPTLGEARGRTMFSIDNGDEIRDLYTDGHPSLEGRAMFVPSEEGRPDAAFIKLNDPIVDQDEIQRLVDAGFIVRTRADADLVQAIAGDVAARRAAFESGAQWVSTDYPATEPPAPESGYTVDFPDGTFARCNPVNATDACDDAQVDPAAP